MAIDENGNSGSSKVPCSDTYGGTAPFSEPEALAIENYLKKNPGIFDVYLSFHSYGHLFLFPYGSTIVRASNFNELQAIGNATRDRLSTYDGIVYRVGSSIETLYTVSGSSRDHVYGEHGIKISFTFEMRGNGDYGNYGFFLPERFIIPNSIEVVGGLIAFVEKAKDFGYLLMK
jgi:hypothetical protein